MQKCSKWFLARSYVVTCYSIPGGSYGISKVVTLQYVNLVLKGCLNPLYPLFLLYSKCDGDVCLAIIIEEIVHFIAWNFNYRIFCPSPSGIISFTMTSR